jgi:NADH dehydrogenase/NADH:ubiquinone oxidoreductase subunit G
MGALTLKSFPFELRGWDIEKLESIDPTDGFGSDTRAYVSKDQIVQIEPDYNIHTTNTWLTDKGRQFFDGIFGTWSKNKNFEKTDYDTPSWLSIIKSITRTLYMFEHCITQQYNKNYLIIVFENLSIELVSLLTILSEKNSFIKLRRAENFKVNNNLEANLQINLAYDKVKLNNSNLCLLISTNPRYEGYYLNLNLRQRYLKGNFKCLIIGSLIDLTFPISFLGSNLSVLKTIVEGNNLVCQEFKSSKNPILIYNYELLKRNDFKNNLEMIKILKYANIVSKIWNGLNTLSPSLNETGTQILNKFLPLTEKDLINFSSLYFLNISTNNLTNLKKITDLKLLNYKNSTTKNQLFLDQTSINNSNFEFFKNINKSDKNKFKDYIYLPSSMFYENEETFINTEGFIKRTTKLIFRKKTKNNWKILRRVFKHLKSNTVSLNEKDNNLISYNSKKINNFRNYINFQYQATKTLTNVNFYLSFKNENFIFTNKFSNFKQNRSKIKLTKLKYWIDDFYNGGKDEYSQNSLILSNCSKILRTKSTNFF